MHAGEDNSLRTATPVLTTQPWSLLLDPPLPGAVNMARDQALLDLAETTGAAWLRLYRWAPFCLSFGRHEPARRRYDRARIEALGLDCVRRPTGGRAVWHARELTYSVAAPIAIFGSLAQAYERIHATLARALVPLGFDAGLAPRAARGGPVDGGACFTRPAGGEVMVAGRKVAGSAQLRQGEAFLQHGSVLLQDSQDMVHRVTRGPAPGSVELTLSAARGDLVSFIEVAESFANAAQAWGGPWTITGGSDAVTARQELHTARFQSEDWTWAR